MVFKKCAFCRRLQEKLDLTKPNLEVLIVDQHMNQPEFANLMSSLLIDMLNGTWKKVA